MLCVTRWYELLTHKLENDKCELELKVWSERLFEAKKKRGNYENKCKLEKKIVDSAYNDDTNMLEES